MTITTFGYLNHPGVKLSVFDIEPYARTADLALSNAMAQTAALVEGFYEVYCASAAFVAVAQDNTGMTTSTGYPLLAGEKKILKVRGGSKIGGILASSTATLLIMQVG